MKLHALALGAFLAAAACAPTASQTGAAPTTGADCFNASFISGYSNVDENTIRVSAGPSREYDLDLEGAGCRDIKWANAVAVVSRPSSYICTGDRPGLGDVKFRDSGSRQITSCFITEVSRYVKPAPPATPAVTQ